MAIQQIEAKDLIVFLSSLKPNAHVRLKLISGDPSQFSFRINSINTRDVYPFSYMNHYHVEPKFNLEPGMNYYIFYDEHIAFNNASKETQLKYLDNMNAFGQNIGCISVEEDQNLILTNCFNFDTFETYIVEENKLYPIKYGNWLRPLKEINSVKASVQIKSIINAIPKDNIIIEVETDDPIPKEPYIEFIEKLETAINESAMFECRKNNGGTSGTYTISIFCVKYRLNMLQIIFDLTATPNSYRGSKPEYAQKNRIKLSQKFREKYMDKRPTIAGVSFDSNTSNAISQLNYMIEGLKEHYSNEDKIICDELLDVINGCN